MKRPQDLADTINQACTTQCMYTYS